MSLGNWDYVAWSRNPLKSGQCFLLAELEGLFVPEYSRNPLKSGQCFLRDIVKIKNDRLMKAYVAIPSNRVNVSYQEILCEGLRVCFHLGRNPLKSGQCFLRLFFI